MSSLVLHQCNKNFSSKDEMYFFEYRPINMVVWNNKNQINWILNQDYYINWWKDNYSIETEIDWDKWQILIDNKNNILEDYAVLDFILYPDNNFYIKNIQNNTKIPWLWVVMINELKRKLKSWKNIYLLDCAKNKKWEKIKWYYEKQWFDEWFF